MKRLHRSLRTRIMLYTAFGLAAILGVMTLFSIQIVGNATQAMLTDWQSDVSNSADYLQAMVAADQRLIRHLAVEISGGGSPDESITDALSRLQVFTHGLVWLGPGARVRAAAPRSIPGLSLPAELAGVLPPTGDLSRLSGLLHGADGRPVVTFATQVNGGGFLIAVADLQAGVLKRFPPLPGPQGHAAVVDHDGWVLESTAAAIKYTRDEHLEWVAQVIKAGVPTVGQTGGTEVHMMAYAPVGGTGWGMLFGEPVTMALTARVQLLHRTLLLGLVAGMLVILFAWWDTGALTRPLSRLTAQARRMAAGDLSTPMAQIQRNDEVGLLGQAFETMRERVRDSQAELSLALAEALRLKEETGALYAVSQEILRPADGGGGLQAIVERTRELLGGTAAAICLAETPDGPLNPVAVSPAGGPAWGTLDLTDSVSAGIAVAGMAPGRLCVTGADARATAEREPGLLPGLATLVALALDHERLEEQSRRLAVYAERERIARDLHDSVTQSLSYLYSQLELMQDVMPSLTPAQMREELLSLSGVASIAFDEARESIYSLRADRDGRDPLPSVIAGCVRDFTGRTGIAVELSADAVAGAPLKAEAETQLVRVIQEALANVSKHAGATRVAVTATVAAGWMEVIVQDDGAGFALPAQGPAHRSFGLKTMRERAESVGGTLEIQSSRGSGTRVRVRIPTQEGGLAIGEDQSPAGR